MRIKKATIAKLLVLCMIVAMLPISALATSIQVGDATAAFDENNTYEPGREGESLNVKVDDGKTYYINAVYQVNLDTVDITKGILAVKSENDAYLVLSDTDVTIEGLSALVSTKDFDAIGTEVYKVELDANVSGSVRNFTNMDKATVLYAYVPADMTIGQFMSNINNNKDALKLSSAPSYWTVKGTTTRWNANNTYAVENDTVLVANYTSSGGGGGGSSSSGSTQSGSTISSRPSVSGSTASYNISVEDANKAANSGSASDPVIIDASNYSGVTTVSVNTDAIKAIAGNANCSGLLIKLPGGIELLFDKDALTAIANAAGANISFTLRTGSADSVLSAAAQKEAVEGLVTGAAFEAEITSDGKTISDFGNGSVTITINFIAPTGREAAKFHVYFVSEAGSLEQQTSTQTSGKLVITVKHFSDYVAIFDPFSDVTASAWYAKYVQYVYDNSIMQGTGNDAFEPLLNMNRAMMVQVLYNLAKASATGSADFSDITAGQWYADAANWAGTTGVSDGMGDGTFAPLGEMTREQLARFMFNYAQTLGKDVSARAALDFPDAGEVSEWATEAMQWAVAAGLINGVELDANNTILAPQTGANRAMLAAVMMRFAELVK